MDTGKENPVPDSLVEPSAEIPDGQTAGTVVDSIPTPLVPPPVVAPLVPTPILPPIAPIPVAPPSIPRPLAPLPVRPPIPRPPQPQNGDIKGSDSDSDHDESKVPRTTAASAEYEISEESRLIRERQERAMQEFLMKRRAAALAVPTNDMAVRARLRRLGEPITLFGEREMERRDRLRMLMAKLDSGGQLDTLMKVHEEEEAAASAALSEGPEEDMIQYPFYTEGSRTLLEARIDIAKYSIVRAAMRLERARRKRDDPDEDLDAETNWALDQAGGLTLDCSEIGDDRPLSGCSFSHDGKMLATWYSLSLPIHTHKFFRESVYCC